MLIEQNIRDGYTKQIFPIKFPFQYLHGIIFNFIQFQHLLRVIPFLKIFPPSNSFIMNTIHIF